jgi:predicted 2-oxoglutarate/Fe(II)-dependent dioxygenase YbiX
MSILLSHPDAFEGGEFMTWDGAAPVIHQAARGDATLFHSEKVHNVTTTKLEPPTFRH